VGPQRGQLRGTIPLMTEQLLQRGATWERWATGEHVKQGAAQRVDVAPHISVARIAGLFGSNVVERSEGHPGGGQVLLGLLGRSYLVNACEPHVDQLRLP